MSSFLRIGSLTGLLSELPLVHVGIRTWCLAFHTGLQQQQQLRTSAPAGETQEGKAPFACVPHTERPGPATCAPGTGTVRTVTVSRNPAGNHSRRQAGSQRRLGGGAGRPGQAWKNGARRGKRLLSKRALSGRRPPRHTKLNCLWNPREGLRGWGWGLLEGSSVPARSTELNCKLRVLPTVPILETKLQLWAGVGMPGCSQASLSAQATVFFCPPPHTPRGGGAPAATECAECLASAVRCSLHKWGQGRGGPPLIGLIPFESHLGSRRSHRWAQIPFIHNKLASSCPPDFSTSGFPPPPLSPFSPLCTIFYTSVPIPPSVLSFF